jgi:iron complex outermembrane recepter protein
MLCSPSPKTWPVCFALLCGVCHTCGTANAQTAVEGSADTLEEIIVTAEKRSEASSRVGMSIDAFTAQDLQLQGISTVEDLVKITPGLNYTLSTYGTPVYTIRGIGYYDNSVGAPPTVSVYSDEIPLPYSAMTKGASLDLQRAEILKGPQGTLYGENSTGGAINFIAAKPTDTFTAGADASYGRFNAVMLDGFISGPLTDQLQARLAVETQQGGAWQRSYTRYDTLGNKDESKGRLLLDWTPDSSLTISLNVNGWVDYSDSQAPQLSYVQLGNTSPSIPAAVKNALLAYPVSPDNPTSADWNPGVPLKLDENFFQSSLRANYQLSDALTLTSIVAFEKYAQNDTSDADGMALDDDRVTAIANDNSIYQELRLTGDTDNKQLRWLIGENYARDNSSEQDHLLIADSTTAYGFAALGVPPFTALVPVDNQLVRTPSAFADLQYHLLDNLAVEGGARYTNSDNTFSGCTKDVDGNLAAGFNTLAYLIRGPGNFVPTPQGGCATRDLNFNPVDVHETLDEHNVPWRVGLNWNLDEGTLVYGNISRGFKAGAFSNIIATSAAQYVPAKQESVLAYELGFKSNFDTRKARLDGAIFYYDYTDKQLRSRIPDPLHIFQPLPITVNVPKSTVQGGELEAAWLPAKGLTITAGASYVSSKVDGTFLAYTPFGATTNWGGQAFPFTPKWYVDGGFNYDRDLPGNRFAFVGANANFQGSTTSAFSAPNSFRLPDYVLVDCRAGVATNDDTWRFFLWGKNIFNRYYLINAINNGSDAVIRYAGMPATYGISVTYRYH